MTEPRHGKQIKKKTTLLQFGGFTPIASEVVIIEGRKLQDSTWTVLTTAQTSATPTGGPDADGLQWYVWNTNVTLPTSLAYWSESGDPGGSNRLLSMTVRSRRQSGELHSFPVGATADQCMIDVFGETGSGLDTRDACSRGVSSASIRVPCGDKWEACCSGLNSINSQCNWGNVCRSNVCVPTQVTMTPSGMVSSSTGTCAATMAGGPCMTQPEGCSSGLTSVQGTITCTAAGAPVCTVRNGIDYCSITGSELCGGSASQSCQYNEQCGPGTVCNQFTHVCAVIDNCRRRSGFCWPPKASANAIPPVGARNQDACIF
jgi:hypothetical protein